MSSFEDLYKTALKLSQEAPPFVETPEKTARQTVEDIQVVQKALLDTLLDGIETKIIESAKLGKQYVDLLVFSGSEKFQDHSYLFLLKGAREESQRVELDQYGFAPLLHTLKDVLRPFTVQHTWINGLNKNKVIVWW